MNNLIINGVDHSAFNLEWAKRGGVCAIADHSEFGLFKYIRPINKALHYFCDIEYLDDFGATMIPNDMRMATPAECEAAGVEYIEYHGWRPIESAPTDERIIEVADFRVVVANECPLSKHWKFWRDIPHPLNKNSMTQPLKDE